METPSLVRQGRVPSLFEDFFRSFSPFSSWYDEGGRYLSVPAANIMEEKDNYRIALAAPGMKKEDFKIDLDGNKLTVSAETEEKREETREQFTRQEYNYSSFSRSFVLPEDVNREKIEARYDNGVLDLRLPKREEAIRAAVNKQIEVK